MCVAVTKLQSYITCEGLYGVLIRCYGNQIFPPPFWQQTTTEISSEATLNTLQFQQVLRHRNPVNVTSCLCMCVSVHTKKHHIKMNITTFACYIVLCSQSIFDKSLATQDYPQLLDGRHRSENPMVQDALWSWFQHNTQGFEIKL